MANRFYEMQVAGCKRKLPIINLNEEIAIAGFIILGDIELTEKAAEALVAKVPQDVDVILTAETKGIPLAEAMARKMGLQHYVVARKSVKAYMENPLIVEDESITTQGKQILCLMDDDIERIRGHKVLLVDDVISTGGSLKALENLAEQAGGQIVGKCAVLAEGDAINRGDIIYLEELPFFDAE
ncbi:MAG: adenine phosphoribosyltransferase [Dialister sp.]|nr:adenine phosphoribosyltransferase [Dialister sp.]